MSTFDIGPDDGFDAAVGQALAAHGFKEEPADASSGFEMAGEPEAPAAEEAEAPAGRERDATGKFVAKTVDEPEAEAEAEVEGDGDVEETAAEKLLAGRYKTVDDLEAAHEELKRKLSEQGSELGELRALRAEFEQLRSSMTTAAQPAYDRDELDDYLDTNAAALGQIVEHARVNNDGVLYEAAINKWYETNPRQASAYERHFELQAIRQEQAAVQQPQVLQSATATLAQRYEDFGTVLNTLRDSDDPDALALAREVAAAPDQAGKERKLGVLYHYLRSQQTGPIREAVAAAAKDEAEQERREKVGATVASAATTPAPKAPLTAEQQIQKEWADMESTYTSGWTYEGQPTEAPIFQAPPTRRR